MDEINTSTETLYNISSNLLELINNGIVFDEETAEVFFDAQDMDALAIRLADKLEAVQVVSSNKRERANYLKTEARRLMDSAKFLERSADSLDSYAVKCVQPLGKIETPHFTISTRTRDAVSIIDEQEIPNEFMRVKTLTEPDKKAIKEAFKEGVNVPGAAIVKNVHLAVR